MLFRRTFYCSMVKPALDRLCALAFLVATSPLLLAISCSLLISNRGSIFFTQKRPGFRAKPFYIIKFKTMNDRRDENGDLLPDDQRLTVIGGILRKTSLDELPQLLNILAGQLSFIGPRPLLMDYLPHYNERQARRHNVKPGITGWAQINGRNSLTWEEKFEYDVDYVENISPWFDLKIALLTIPSALRQRGVEFPEHATDIKFTGTNSRHV